MWCSLFIGFGDVLCVADADRCESLRSQERLLAPLLERCPVLLNRANWAQESKQSKKTRSLGPLKLEHSRTTLSIFVHRVLVCVEYVELCWPYWLENEKRNWKGIECKWSQLSGDSRNACSHNVPHLGPKEFVGCISWSILKQERTTLTVGFASEFSAEDATHAATTITSCIRGVGRTDLSDSLQKKTDRCNCTAKSASRGVLKLEGLVLP